jgi:hypothetical protein
MAVEGSAASVNYGAFLNVVVGKFSVRHYFDIQKVSKSDILLGIPFMSKPDMPVSLGLERHFTIAKTVFADQFNLPASQKPQKYPAH